jgi:hypothetical protein
MPFMVELFVILVLYMADLPTSTLEPEPITIL